MATVTNEVQSLILQSEKLVLFEVKREISVRITSVEGDSCKKNCGIIWTVLVILIAYVDLYVREKNVLS